MKPGKGGQAEAILDRFQPLAPGIGADSGSLPDRPSVSTMVRLAGSEPRRSSLRAEFVDAGAELVITLGQEALDSVRAVADTVTGVQDRLQPQGYGTRGRVVVDGWSGDLLPLVHPGLARQTKRVEWVTALQTWRDTLNSQ